MFGTIYNTKCHMQMFIYSGDHRVHYEPISSNYDLLRNDAQEVAPRDTGKISWRSRVALLLRGTICLHCALSTIQGEGPQ